MQSPTPAHEETPFATPLPANDRRSPSEHTGSDGTNTADAVSADALVPRAAQKIAKLLSDLKHELETLDDHSVKAHGEIEIVLEASGQTSKYALEIVSHAEGISIGVEAERASNREAASVNGAGADTSNAILIEDDSAGTETGATTTSYRKRIRHDSDAELEKELVSRKRQRLDKGDNDAKTQQEAAGDDDDIMPLITKEDLENIIAKLREDIQEDTSECVNHVQRLLRRFKEEWHEKNTWDFKQASNNQKGRAARRSVIGNGLGAAFPSPGADQDDQDVTVPELIKQESKLISSQIRWVEDCRRLASEAHDKREENWRTSSANFHDKARQERESFQGRILHEQGMQTQTLHQILSEVKAFGLYVQSMKWETPSSLSVGPAYHPGPVAPAFPTQPPPAPPRGRGGGAARGK